MHNQYGMFALCAVLLMSFALIQAFHQRYYDVRLRIRSTKVSIIGLNAKGFGLGSGEPVSNEKNSSSSAVMKTIEEKEQEFQAELDKLMAEAKANNELLNKEGGELTNEDLARAFLELQKLRNEYKKSPVVRSEDGLQLVTVVIPKGARPGDTMILQLNRGSFEIEVPEGVVEGDEIEVEL